MCIGAKGRTGRPRQWHSAEPTFFVYTFRKDRFEQKKAQFMKKFMLTVKRNWGENRKKKLKSIIYNIYFYYHIKLVNVAIKQYFLFINMHMILLDCPHGYK